MHIRDQLLELLAGGGSYSASTLAARLRLAHGKVDEIISEWRRDGLEIIDEPEEDRVYRLLNPERLLSSKRVYSRLRPEVKKVLRRLEVFPVVTSTNQYLLERPGEHAYAVFAEYQTRGRGRRGRVWRSFFGAGINLSLSWRFQRPPPSLTRLTLAAAVAVVQALGEMGFSELRIKWPNDILFCGKKLGGILVEVDSAASSGVCRVVLGLGLNLALPPGSTMNIGQASTDLASTGAPLPARDHIAAELLSALVLLFDAYPASPTAKTFIKEWRQYDYVWDRHVRLILPHQNIHGRALGIDGDGALLLCVNERVEKYTMGEISLRVEE